MRKIISLCFLLFFTCFAYADNPQPLPVDQAFQLTVKNISNNSVQLHWSIAPGYHLYRDNFSFKNANIGQVNLPTGIPKQDDILGNYQVYERSLDLIIPFNKTDKGDNSLLVTYQGCSDKNFCYPPITKKITINFDDLSQTSVQSHEKNKTYTLQDKIMNLLQQKNYFLICLAFIGFGLLLAFTPCVLPMIPILSGIILGQHKQDITTRRAFFVSLSYVVGMSVTYAMAGVLVALAGSHLSETFQAPWVIVLFSALFVVLALSLFGFYELQLPHFLHHRIVSFSNKQKSGSYVGAVIMGALSVLIVSPCVTAPLVGVLTFIAQTGDIILGSTALFALGLGMGIPLLIIGTTEGRFLPKSGPWMNVIKSVFGVLLISVAIYLLQRILPGPISLMLWAGLLIVLAVYLGVGSHHPRVSSGWIKFGKGLGLFSFCYGVILLVGASMGNTDPMRPLKVTTSSISQTAGLNFRSVKNLSDVQAMINQARQQGKPVMLDFYAEWCISCHEMDRNTFGDPAVMEKLKDVVLIRADVTNNDMTDRALQDYFNVVAPPSILFFDRQGKEQSKYRVVGAMSPKDFLDHLHLVY